MYNKIYGLYKRIMKYDPKAIDEIESLEEAKEIIKMIMGNPILFGDFHGSGKSHLWEHLI